MSKTKIIDLIEGHINDLSLPYIAYALEPNFELAEIYLDLVAKKKAGGMLEEPQGSDLQKEFETGILVSAAASPETTIATALTLLQIGVGHHYEAVWPLIHENFLGDTADPRHASADRAARSGLDRDDERHKLFSEDEASDIDLAIGDYFYASAIKVVSSLGLIDIIEASTVAIMKISSGYRKFDDLMQNNAVAGPEQVTEICRECGALYFLAHKLAHLTPGAGHAALAEALVEHDLDSASGIWFRREVETHIKVRPDGQNFRSSESE